MVLYKEHVRNECVSGQYKYVFELIKYDNDDKLVLQEVKLYLKDGEKEIGHFKVEGFLHDTTNSPYNSGRTMDMTIDLDPTHHKKGLSRSMMKYLFKNSEEYFGKIPLDHNIYIDADGSAGFWDAIGMSPNRRTYETSRDQLEGA